MRDGEGLTPMHMACRLRATAQTLRVLVAAGVDTEPSRRRSRARSTWCSRWAACGLGCFLNRTGADKLKKKDEKPRSLKKCLDVLDDIEAVKAETKWDDLLADVLKLVAEVD